MIKPYKSSFSQKCERTIYQAAHNFQYFFDSFEIKESNQFLNYKILRIL